MFSRMRRANDGSNHAFHALDMALAIAQQNNSELHMVSVQDIVDPAAELKVDLLVIGAKGHSALYERLIGSRADRIMQLAHCPALVVK
jgi:nucleotide-binding universal stress UspA family protein